MLRVDQFVPLLTDDAKLLDALPDCVLEKALPRLLAMLPEELQGAVSRFLALPGIPGLAQDYGLPSEGSEGAGEPPGEAVPDGPVEAPVVDEEEYAEVWGAESGDEEDVEKLDEETRRDLKAEAQSTHHQLLHEPKNPWCPVCQCSSMQRTPARRKNMRLKMKPKFGYLTGDTIVGKKTDQAVCTPRLDTKCCFDPPNCLSSEGQNDPPGGSLTPP